MTVARASRSTSETRIFLDVHPAHPPRPADRLRPAPEHDEAPSVFGLTPGEFEQLGYGGSVCSLFANLHRPWAWARSEAPLLGKQWQSALRGHSLRPMSIHSESTSSDGSTRLVLRAQDERRIEAVWMPRDLKNQRVTLCVSSQIGCGMGCTFCATGAMGIGRNLTA
ncbi:MAG: 23S rRNA (adenine2503-C2)-methyltransferase, partial [Planctomycetota bacterium]